MTFGAPFLLYTCRQAYFARTHHSVDQKRVAKIKGAVIAQCKQLRYQSNMHMRCQMNSVTISDQGSMEISHSGATTADSSSYLLNSLSLLCNVHTISSELQNFQHTIAFLCHSRLQSGNRTHG